MKNTTEKEYLTNRFTSLQNEFDIMLQGSFMKAVRYPHGIQHILSDINNLPDDIGDTMSDSCPSEYHDAILHISQMLNCLEYDIHLENTNHTPPVSFKKDYTILMFALIVLTIVNVVSIVIRYVNL